MLLHVYSSYTYSDVDESGHKIFANFSDTERQPLVDNNCDKPTAEALDVWLSEMSSISGMLENILTQLSQTSVVPNHDHCYGSVSLFLLPINDIMDTLTLYFQASAEEKLQLDAEAFYSVCNTSWHPKPADLL